MARNQRRDGAARARIASAVIEQVRGLPRSPEIIVHTWREGREFLDGIREADVRKALTRSIRCGMTLLAPEIFEAILVGGSRRLQSGQRDKAISDRLGGQSKIIEFEPRPSEITKALTSIGICRCSAAIAARSLLAKRPS